MVKPRFENKQKSLTAIQKLSTVGLLFCMTVSVILIKQLNHLKFKHSFLLSWFPFFSQTTFFAIFLTQTRKNLSKLRAQPTADLKKKFEFPYMWMVVIVTLELLIRSISVMSIILLPPSINTIISGSKIIWTIIFSRTILRKNVEAKDYFTIALMVLGSAFTGYSVLLKGGSKSTGSEGTIILGITLTVIDNIMSSLIVVLFEFLMKKYTVNPIRFCGISGCIGMIMNLFVILLASTIPCFDSRICYYGGYLEDPIVALNQIFAQFSTVGVKVIVHFIATSSYILMIMHISGSVSSVYMSVMVSITVVTIWISSVFLGLETLILKPFLYELAGFFLILTGTMVYNKIIKVSKEKIEDEDERNFDEIGSMQSPPNSDES